jgi:ABC-type transport system substrate-binding protein
MALAWRPAGNWSQEHYGPPVTPADVVYSLERQMNPKLGKGLTGAVSSSAYLFSPWADQLGGTG